MLTRSLKMALAGTALMLVSTAAEATQFVQYSFSGTVSGIRTNQPMNGPGTREEVTGRATFTYILPSDRPVTTAYFNGGQTSFSSGSSTTGFGETGYNGIGTKGQITATACFGSGGSVSAECGFARLLDGWKNGSYDLTGTIDSFSSTVLSTASSVGFTGYSFALAPARSSSAAITAVPEPTSWAMMLAGFALLGGALRRRPARVLAVA